MGSEIKSAAYFVGIVYFKMPCSEILRLSKQLFDGLE
jgi:hypothetical protein